MKSAMTTILRDLEKCIMGYYSIVVCVDTEIGGST